MAAARLPVHDLAQNPSLQLAATLAKPFAIDVLRPQSKSFPVLVAILVQSPMFVWGFLEHPMLKHLRLFPFADSLVFSPPSPNCPHNPSKSASINAANCHLLKLPCFCARLNATPNRDLARSKFPNAHSGLS
jgi:hypothetical protein